MVLLPGLDGTGKLFADFVESLRTSWPATVVSYPTDTFLSYADLRPFVTAAAPQSQQFVLLAESFSTPLALWYAACAPANLSAVVLCAGFVRNPLRRWSKLAKTVTRPLLFKLEPPQMILEYFLLGKNAPPQTVRNLRQALRNVSPHVLSGRVQEVLNCDARETLGRITVPLLYLEPTNDRLLSPLCRDDFSRLKPDTLFKAVPGPHLLLQREPQKTANIVRNFVNALAVKP